MSLDADNRIVPEHTPLGFVGAVDRDVARRRRATRPFDFAVRAKQAVHGSGGTVLLDEGNGGKASSLGGYGGADGLGFEVDHICILLDFACGG